MIILSIMAQPSQSCHFSFSIFLLQISDIVPFYGNFKTPSSEPPNDDWNLISEPSEVWEAPLKSFNMEDEKLDDEKDTDESEQVPEVCNCHQHLFIQGISVQNVKYKIMITAGLSFVKKKIKKVT